MEGKRVVSNSSCKCWLEGQILRVTIKPGLILNLQGAKEIEKLRTEISEGKSYPILFDLRGIQLVDTETFDYLRNRKSGGELVNSVALIVSNEIEQIIAEAFQYIHKSYFAYQIFTNEVQALHWLNKHVDK